jgi:molecular chaperone DnaK
LRDRVSQQLGITILPEYIDPMTAVAKGAAIYADSLSDGEIKPTAEVQESTTEYPLELAFDSRVSGNVANLTVTLKNLDIKEVKVHVRNAAYSSGELTVNFSKTIPLTLTDDGVNSFVVEVIIPGQSRALSRTIEITKSLEIQGIPMATSLFVEVVSRDGLSTEPEYLVKVGEGLPKKGEFRVVSQVELSKKSENAIRFRLYQGEISDRVIDNTFIGELKLESSILGRADKISIGDELICGFEVGEGLELKLNVSVPTIGERFDGLYMPGEAVKNPTEDWEEFAESGRNLKKSLERYVQQNPNEQLESKIRQLQDAIDTIESSLVDEEVQSAAEKVRQVRRDFFEARRGDAPRRLLARYQHTYDFFHSKFEGRVQANATNGERKVFMQHAANAEAAARAGDESLWNSEDDEMWEVLRAIIWRSEWWLRLELDSFKTRGSAEQRALAMDGLERLDASDFNGARQTLNELFASSNADEPKLKGVDVRKI